MLSTAPQRIRQITNLSKLWCFRSMATAESPNIPLVEDFSAEKEAEIERKRNKSRLAAAHQNIVNGKRPYEVPSALVHKTVKYNRKIFGKYGAKSGVNPSLCWPSHKDIEEREEYESVAFPFTIQQMMEMAAEKRNTQREFTLQRERTIIAKMEKLEQWKKDLHHRMSKKIAEAQAAKEKKERLVEEVRRHFGFKLDPRDERFQEMLNKREKEQKKLEKMAKKEAREKEVIAKIQQQNAEIEHSTKSTK